MVFVNYFYKHLGTFPISFDIDNKNAMVSAVKQSYGDVIARNVVMWQSHKKGIFIPALI